MLQNERETFPLKELLTWSSFLATV